jgi:hypothetical protein
MPTTSVALDQPRVLVQTAGVLPSDDAGWTLQPWAQFMGGSEGCLPILGDASIAVPAGELLAPSGTAFESVAFADLIGNLVRLLKQEDSGSILVGGKYYSQFWTGQITGQASDPDGGTGESTGGMVSLDCTGIISLLEQITITDGHVIASGAAVSIGHQPPVNAREWGRSSSKVNLPGGTAYVFDPTNPGQAWSAYDYLEYLLAAFAPTGVALWQLGGDATSALAYKPDETALNGATILQAILGLIDPQRGLTARQEVSGSTVTLVVRTGSPVAIDLDDYTLPANTDTLTVTIGGNPALGGVSLIEDRSSMYGVLKLRGAYPCVGLTGVYDGTETCMFGKGWSDDSETEWEEDYENPEVEHVFRLFTVQATWNGSQYDGSGLQGILTTETSDAYGIQGLNGERTTGGYGAGKIPGQAVTLEGRIPDGINKGEWLKPVIIVEKSGNCVNKSKDWKVSIENEPPGIRIDDGKNGELVRDFMNSNWKILVSLGVREAQPLAVSWVGGNSTRVKGVDLKNVEHWRIAPDMVVGVMNGAVVTAAGGDIRDDRPQLRAGLAMLRARFTEPDWTLTLTQQGVLDIDSTTGAPGQLVLTADRGDQELTTNVLITRRRWSRSRVDGAEYWNTSIIANRVLPDIGAVK